MEKIKSIIAGIVAARGKQQNPVTGSGGMLIGKVAKIGIALAGRDLKVGDKIASLVSLSLTPLNIGRISRSTPRSTDSRSRPRPSSSSPASTPSFPPDMDEGLALAALDVAGAPAQTAKLVKPGMSVLVLGAGGKSGILCCYEAMKRVGPTGRVIAVIHSERSRKTLYRPQARPRDRHRRRHQAHRGPRRRARRQRRQGSRPLHQLRQHPGRRDGLDSARAATTGRSTSSRMATSFTRAALGAEGIGKDVTMIIGNGYTKDHAEITLWELRENPGLRKLFETQYVK